MPQNYKVEAVHGQSEWEGQYGPMVTYNLLANGEDVELNQKPTTPPPTVGQIIYGHTEHGREGFPPKLKKDRREDAGSGTSFHAAAPRPQNGGPSHDEREKRIVRQHSQEMAIRWYSVIERDEVDRNVLLEMIDFFEADAFGQSSPQRRPSPADESEAEQGGGAAETSPPSPISSDDANFLRNRVIDAKIDSGDVVAWLGAQGLKNLDQLNEKQATVFAKWLDDSTAPF